MKMVLYNNLLLIVYSNKNIEDKETIKPNIIKSFDFSLPFLLMILPLIKTKAGLTLLQILRIWGLLRFLRNSGRFNFNNMGSANNSQSISLDEAYKILNLNTKKKYSKEEVMKSYKNIMKKIHPDVSPELSRLASIVNEAKEVVLKDIS